MNNLHDYVTERWHKHEITALERSVTNITSDYSQL